MKRSRLPFFAAVIFSVGCSSSPPDVPPDVDADPTVYKADCDPILGTRPDLPCAMPWPSNLYLEPNAATKTGYSLVFGPTSLPESSKGKNISPDGYKKLDGYGPSTPIIVHLPNVDLNGVATEDHIERSLDDAAPIVIFEDNGRTLRRVPYFAELDKTEPNAVDKTLFVRPAEILKEATRYVVAFRNLRDTSGQAFKPTRAFERLRDGKTDGEPLLQKRQERFNKVFASLLSQRIEAKSLLVAWDFVTASSQAMHGDLIKMRDDALARTGAMGPQLTVDKVIEFVPAPDGSGKPVDANIAVELQGTFTVPSYVVPWATEGFNGWRLNRDGNGQVTPSGTRAPRFWVRIPYSATDGNSVPHGVMMYGHGLLGEGRQVTGGFNSRIANRNKLILFAADLTGMADADQADVLVIMQELSRFPSMGDRLHQGLTEWVLLTRAMRERLDTLPETMKYKVKVNRDEVFYSGISQGGIFGASFVALSPDVKRGHLGVPGNNYSLLLQRSSDFDPFAVVFSATYPSTRDQALAISLMQLLWDSTDPVTHYRHLMKEPHPGNGVHEVLLAPARGDYQVAVLANEIVARSDVGVQVMAHYDDERSVYGVKEQVYPHRGSGIVLWHFGNPWPAIGNLPPSDPPGDPHGKPRQRDTHNDQMVHFLKTGEIIDVCGGMSCWPDGRP